MAFPVPHAASRFRDPYREVAGLAILKIATAQLRRLDRQGQPLPDEDALSNIVLDVAIKTEPRGLFPGTMVHRWEPGLTRDQMNDLILRKCRAALRDFKPAQAPFSAAQSRRGGARSRRTRKALIARYRELQTRLDATGEVLTRVEIAKRLKVDVSTVYRMLAELKPTPLAVLAPPSEILDLLDSEFPKTLADIASIPAIKWAV